MSGTNVFLMRSTDTGAPSLSGSAGAVIALLDACLLNGFNSKSVASITLSGTTATATFATAHGYAADGLSQVAHSNATQAAYNGTFQIFNVTTLSYQFTVTGSPASPATGTITAVQAPLGWTKPFAGTNLGVYRSAQVTGTQLYLHVDDTNPNADSYKTANIRGYETMNDVNTGAGLFPTVAQLTSGLYVYKSITSDSTARLWFLVGDGFEFFLFTAANNPSYPNQFFLHHFGDPKSEMSSDPFGCFISGQTALTIGSPGADTGAQIITSSLMVQTGAYMARSYSQTGTSVACGKLGNYTVGSQIIGSAGLAYPALGNNALYITPIGLYDGVIIRALLAGIYQPLHSKPLGNGGFLAANVSPIGRRLFAICTGGTGEMHIDLDGPWR